MQTVFTTTPGFTLTRSVSLLLRLEIAKLVSTAWNVAYNFYVALVAHAI